MFGITCAAAATICMIWIMADAELQSAIAGMNSQPSMPIWDRVPRHSTRSSELTMTVITRRKIAFGQHASIKPATGARENAN